MKPQPLWRGASVFALAEGLGLAVAFLLQPWLMRRLGPDSYGLAALGVAWGVAAVTAVYFGFNFGGVVHAVALAREGAAPQRRGFWAVLAIKAAVGLLLAAVAVLHAAVGGGAASRVVAQGVVMGALAAWSMPTWYLMAQQRLQSVAAALLAARVAFLLLALAWVRGADDVTPALVCTLAPPVVAGALLWLFEPALRGARPWCWPGRAELRRAARAGGASLWISAQPVVGGFLMQTVLFAATSGSSLGHYAAADRVRAGVQGLFTAFGNALLPGLARRAGGAPAPWRLVAVQAAVATLLAVLVALGAGPIVHLLAGPGWEAAVPVLRVLALALVSSTLLSAVGVQLLLPAGRARAYSVVLALLLLAQLAGLWWAAPQGALAAAWVLLLAEACAASALTAWAAWTRRTSSR